MMTDAKPMKSPTRNARHGHAISGFFVLCLIALFAVLSTLLTLFGIRVYRSVYDASSANSESQIALSYLVNKVHSGDRAGCVTVSTVDGMDVLAIREPLEDGIFETRIFCQNGSLCEYFCEAGEAFDAELGTALADMSSLAVTFEEPWLLSIVINQDKTGSARTHVALRGEATP